MAEMNDEQASPEQGEMFELDDDERLLFGGVRVRPGIGRNVRAGR